MLFFSMEDKYTFQTRDTMFANSTLNCCGTKFTLTYCGTVHTFQLAIRSGMSPKRSFSANCLPWPCNKIFRHLHNCHLVKLLKHITWSNPSDTIVEMERTGAKSSLSTRILLSLVDAFAEGGT